MSEAIWSTLDAHLRATSRLHWRAVDLSIHLLLLITEFAPELFPSRSLHDKNAAYPKALKELKAADTVPDVCELRQVKYLNTIVEQEHRFIKWLVKPGLGFFSFETAWRTLRGYEAMHMMRKGQIQGVEKGDIRGQVTFIALLFGVAA